MKSRKENWVNSAASLVMVNGVEVLVVHLTGTIVMVIYRCLSPIKCQQSVICVVVVDNTVILMNGFLIDVLQPSIIAELYLYAANAFIKLVTIRPV